MSLGNGSFAFYNFFSGEKRVICKLIFPLLEMYRLQSSCQAESVMLFNAVDRFSCSEFHAVTLYKFYKYLSHLVKIQCEHFFSP